MGNFCPASPAMAVPRKVSKKAQGGRPPMAICNVAAYSITRELLRLSYGGAWAHTGGALGLRFPSRRRRPG